jgi:glycosyltransferase involved in cell wall biosynthesis
LRSLVTGGAGRPGPGPIVTDPRHSAADPFISIVVATYNSGRHLAACLESITRQDFRSFELIVIDGGSTDDTLEIADRYRDRIAYLVSEPDRGIYHAWNKALAVLRGTWVLFIGSDDRLASPGVLGAAVPWLESADSSTRIVYGSIRLTDDGRDTGQVLGLPWSEARPLLRSWMSIPHPATFHHRALFRDHGVFDESFAIAGDYEFVLRELLTAEAAFIPELVVVEMGIGGISSRPDNIVRIEIEKERARRLHGLGFGPPWLEFGVLRKSVRLAIAKTLGPAASERARLAWTAARRRLSGH